MIFDPTVLLLIITIRIKRRKESFPHHGNIDLTSQLTAPPFSGLYSSQSPGWHGSRCSQCYRPYGGMSLWGLQLSAWRLCGAGIGQAGSWMTLQLLNNGLWPTWELVRTEQTVCFLSSSLVRQLTQHNLPLDYKALSVPPTCSGTWSHN